MNIAVIILLQIVFWISVGAIIHTYAIYPMLLRIIARKRKLEGPVHSPEGPDLPPVAVLMAVYNEESVLEETLESIFKNDYPEDKLKVYIGSDNSTDGSHRIIESFQKDHPNLHLEMFPGRNGKIRIINRLFEIAKEQFSGSEDEPVLILCDANVTWSSKLVYHLVKHFVRPEVGLVASNVLDRRDAHEGIGAAEEAYVNGENLTKFAEGVLWGRTMGAFGACYAMRADLFEPVPTNYIVDDFYLTLNCFMQERDAIVDLEATCFEAVSEEVSEEFRRKQRISTGNFQNLNHFRSFLMPWVCGIPTWFAFWSHKGLRWTGPLFLIAAIVTSVILSFQMIPLYWLSTAGLAMTFLAAIFVGVASKMNSVISVKLFRFVRYFYLMNLALFIGMLRFLRGTGNSTWEPTQRPVDVGRSAIGAGS